MDDVDRANEHAEFFRREALRAHFSRCGKYTASEVEYPGETSSMNGVGGSSPGPRGCSDCGHMIDPARLEAMPAASRCIRCQILHERHEEGNAL